MFAALIEPGPFWLLIGSIGATTLILFRIAARRRQATPNSQEVAPSATSRTPRGVERWEAELHEFAREVEARLDNKIAALQQLLILADQRTAKLESLGLEPLPQQTATEPAATLSGPHFPPSANRHNTQTAVIAMHDAGNGAAAIANRLQLPIGEVELMLSLRVPPNR